MAVADLELQAILALDRRLEADTVDLERMRIALGHPLNEIEDLGSRHAPHRPRLLRRLERLELNAVRGLFDTEFVGTDEGQLALGSVHLDALSSDHRGDPCGQRNRPPANSRHCRHPTPKIPPTAAPS